MKQALQLVSVYGGSLVAMVLVVVMIGYLFGHLIALLAGCL